MALILVANSKGGCGKSTIATNIASILAGTNGDVLLADADRQITASMWAHERKRAYPDHPKINSVVLYGDLYDSLKDLDSRYSYVVVDAAGHDSVEMRSGMKACDILLMPFRPSNPDLATLPKMAEMVKDSKRVNPPMKAFAFINSAPTNRRDAVFACEALAEYQDIFTVLETTIHDRRIFRDAMAEGLGVIEMAGKSDSDNNARAEINGLMQEIMK